MRRPRRLVLAAAALGLMAATTGCSYFNPVQTHDFYQAADGTNGSLMTEQGTFLVGVRNAIVVVQPDGSAQLRGSVVNYTTEDVSVELAGSAEETAAFSTRVSVPGEDVVALGPGESEQLVAIGTLDVAPGDIMELTLSAEGQSLEISLPVTDTTLEYYGGTGPSDGGGEAAEEESEGGH